ncbi:GNAT family N-acetyltransferase [Paenibacillus anaericanus]|nr:N-acetyltransferase [Paenibacillus anaericanus]
MRNIVIVPYQREDYESICRLLVKSFQGKFHSLVQLDDEDIIKLLSKIWLNESECVSEKQMVVKEDGELVGTIFLKWKDESSPPKISTNYNSRALFKQFGFITVCKFIIGMGMLEYKPQEQECYIEHIAIHSMYRNQGMGKLVLTWAKDFVQQHPEFEELTLFVSGKNNNAIHLYEKAGFHIEKSKYNFKRHLFFQEPLWHLMTWRSKNAGGEAIEKTF